MLTCTIEAVKGGHFMSTPAQPRTSRRGITSLTTLLAVIAIGIALFALYEVHRSDSGIEPDVNVSDGITVQEATHILERANDATNFVGNLLSFLEVSMAAISLAMIVGGWMLRSMILDQIEESRELGQRIDNELLTYRDRFEELEVMVERRLNVLSLQLLAEQQVRAHNTDTAIATLQRAIAIDADDHATNYLLGYLYMQRREIGQAIEHLQRALTREPDFTPAIAALGLALRRKGDSLTDPNQKTERNHYWQQAEARLKEALARDPRLTDAEGESYYGSLGGLYRRQERFYAALDAYERAHEVTPNSSYPLINLASIHKRLGNDAAAERYFRDVVKRALWQLDDDPRDTWTRCDLAQALLVLGEADAAFEQFERALDQDPTPGLLETVRSGLEFLTHAPTPIPRLDAFIAAIDKALARMETDSTDA